MIGYDYNKGFSTVTNRSQLILRQAMNQKWIKIVIKTIYPINARLMTLNCVFEWFFFSWSLQLTQVATSTREVATRRAVRSLQRLIWWHDFPFGFVARSFYSTAEPATWLTSVSDIPGNRWSRSEVVPSGPALPRLFFQTWTSPSRISADPELLE